MQFLMARIYHGHVLVTHEINDEKVQHKQSVIVLDGKLKKVFEGDLGSAQQYAKRATQRAAAQAVLSAGE